MLASIHPLGERARNRSWGVTVSTYLAGSVAGGAVVGALLGLAGLGLHRLFGMGPVLRLALAAAVCLAGVALDLRLGGLRTPTVRRQVDDEWMFLYRSWVYGGGFGFQLGMGVVTIVTTASIYVVFALALLAASPATGALIGLTFGLARGAVVLTAARVDDPARLRDLHRRLQTWDRPSYRLAVAAQVAVALLVLAAVISEREGPWLL
jgi:hypothetical protein